MSDREAGDDRPESEENRQSVEAPARDASNRAERPDLRSQERAAETPTSRSDQSASQEARDLRARLAQPVSYEGRADDEARLAELEREASSDRRAADPGNRAERPSLAPAERREAEPEERRQRETDELQERLAEPASYEGRDTDEQRLEELKQVEERRTNLPKLVEAVEQDLRARLGGQIRSVYAVRLDSSTDTYDIRAKVVEEKGVPGFSAPGVPYTFTFTQARDVSIGLYDVESGQVREPLSRDALIPATGPVELLLDVVAGAALAKAAVAGLKGVVGRAIRAGGRRAATAAEGALEAGALGRSIERAVEGRGIGAAAREAGEARAAGATTRGALEAGEAGRAAERAAADSSRVGRSAVERPPAGAAEGAVEGEALGRSAERAAERGGAGAAAEAAGSRTAGATTQGALEAGEAGRAAERATTGTPQAGRSAVERPPVGEVERAGARASDGAAEGVAAARSAARLEGGAGAAAARVRPAGEVASEKAIEQRIADVQRRINEERVRIGELRERVGPARWNAIQRTETKHFYNLMERRQLLDLQRTFPDRRFLQQVEVIGVRRPDGTLLRTPEIAGKGRIADYAEISGNRVALGDLKSSSEILKSVQGGLRRPAEIESTFRSTSTIGRQIEIERQVIGKANEVGGRVVIRGRDVVTGRQVTHEVEASAIGVSRVSDYRSLPRN